MNPKLSGDDPLDGLLLGVPIELEQVSEPEIAPSAEESEPAIFKFPDELPGADFHPRLSRFDDAA